jgi:hypothetical protein
MCVSTLPIKLSDVIIHNRVRRTSEVLMRNIPQSFISARAADRGFKQRRHKKRNVVGEKESEVDRTFTSRGNGVRNNYLLLLVAVHGCRNAASYYFVLFSSILVFLEYLALARKQAAVLMLEAEPFEELGLATAGGAGNTRRRRS